MTALEKLYRTPTEGKPVWVGAGVRLAQFLAQTVTEFTKDYCVIRASGLAYTSLLALVPLTAIVFSLFASFSAFEGMKDSIQRLMFQFFIPTKSDDILKYINEFTSNTKALGTIGSVFLLVTSIMLFQNIEKSLNAVWKVRDHRKTYQRFVIFTSVLVWGTVLVGLSFYITGKARAFIGLVGEEQVGFPLRQLLALFPTFLSAAAFVLLMQIVPSTRVRWKSAMVGGLTGGCLWEIAKQAFAHYASGAVSYSVIYGSLALIPIFLVWLYLTWIIVMLATEVTYVHQNFFALLQKRTYGELSARDEILLSLQIYLFTALRFHRGDGATTADEIQERFHAPIEILQGILDKFIDRGHVLLVQEPVPGYVPSRSLDQVHVPDLVRAVYRPGNGESDDGAELTDKMARDLVDRFEEAGLGSLGTDSLAARLLNIENVS
ncbi:MAG: YihY family inner membrane protein [Deltaproteobacteria bacterium]|nr:YihY family inner membrane protein [Deltaproteobacteria bacterium]